MYEVTGRSFSCCDGITRRSFIRAGALGVGGLTLPQILSQRARASEAGRSLPKTSVIYIELAGGPSQFETYDPKPNLSGRPRNLLDKGELVRELI